MWSKQPKWPRGEIMTPLIILKAQEVHLNKNVCFRTLCIQDGWVDFFQGHISNGSSALCFPSIYSEWDFKPYRPVRIEGGQGLFTIALHHRPSNLIPIRRRQTPLWNHFGKLKTACPSSSNISWPTFCCSAISNILRFIDLAWVSLACLHVSLSLVSSWFLHHWFCD